MKLEDIDLTDRDQYVEGVPFDTFDLMRSEAPFFWHARDIDNGPGFWALTRYPDVVEVNRDIERFSSARRTALMNELEPDHLEQQRMLMLNMDPPMHTRYRLLVNKGFTPRMVGKLEEGLRSRTRRIIQECVDRGEADFVTDIAAELPLQAIADIMGVPQEDRHKVFDWSNRMVGAEDPEYQSSAELAGEAAAELYAYANQLAAEKRANPSDDIITVLLGAEVEGDKLSELEFDLFFLLLSVAGNETTRNNIAHGMLAFFDHPDQWNRLVEDRSLVPGAIDEVLRWGTPVMQFRRTATRDTDVGGNPVKEGDKIVVWYIAANRDPEQFPDPYTFDVTRSPNEHVAFGGGGPHFCLGANLARLEMRIMFEELLDIAPNIEQTGPPARLRSNFINGIKHLPVGFPS
jgi:cholest-4-en-3-one 26-monooxygenase